SLGRQEGRFAIKPPRPSLTTGYGALRVAAAVPIGRRPQPRQARGSRACAARDPRDRAAQAQGVRRFFRALAAEKFAALLAGIWIVCPVDGLRPRRAARELTLNLPKPASATSPPAANSSDTASIVLSSTWRAWLADSPFRLATCSASSFLVIPLPSRVSLLA